MTELQRTTPAAGQANGGAIENGQAQYNTNHAYLERKGIDFEALQAACPGRIEIRQDSVKTEAGTYTEQFLFRELVDISGGHNGYERILPERIVKEEGGKPNDKFTNPGSKVSGTFTPIGFEASELLSMGDWLIVCAGLADGYRLHEATGLPVACCVGENNIRGVVEAIRPLNPNLFAAVDNDEAGKRAGDSLNVPWCCPESDKDWSDVYQSNGLAEVKRQFEAGIKAASEQPQTVNESDHKRNTSENDHPELPMGPQTETQPEPDELFTQPARAALELPEGFKQTVIGKLASRMAYCLEFPEASTAMALLSGASAAVATSYAVQYASGTPIPTGIYTVIEQPPSTSKSRLLKNAQSPYLKAMGEHNRRIRAHNDKLDKDDPKARVGFDVTTDPTTAGMDMVLATCSEGRFFVASAEQAAFQAMFPEKGDFASHNGLLLQGWAGEYASAMRKGRAAFTGYVNGSILVIAQPGSAARVFNASNGTGLAERFFYVSEPTLLGTRTLHGDFVRREEIEPFNRACQSCVEDYSNRRFAVLEEPQDPDSLRQLTLDDSGYRLLLEARRSLEPTLGKLAKDGEMLQVGWLGKIETHALKIAAILHVVECLAHGKAAPDTIPTATVKIALDLTKVLADHFAQLLHDSGESGEVAEVDSVIELVTSLKRPCNARTIAQKLRKRQPFRSMDKEAYTRARARVDAMLSEGRLKALPDKTIEAA